MLSKGRAFQIRSIEILYRLCAKKRDGPPGFFTQDLKCAVDLTPLSVQSGVRNHTPHFFCFAFSKRDLLVGEQPCQGCASRQALSNRPSTRSLRSEEHTSELQSLRHLVCRLLL